MNSYVSTYNQSTLRDPIVVMDLERLGNMHQNRNSFVRSLIRVMAKQEWKIENIHWEFCSKGFGYAIYKLITPKNFYHFIAFSNEISDFERNDRVIAEKWDVTFALFEGEINQNLIDQLRINIPLQEAGRNLNNVLVLSRANKSVRIFEHILDSLAVGKQPDYKELSKVGYVLRTTAVYGNGKFGISDFSLLKDNPDFSQSFRAQMCAVYILRVFSADWIDYLAVQRGGEKAVKLSTPIKRYLGVGNATGLGMAPYLIKHPTIIDQWITVRELALSAILDRRIDSEKFIFLQSLLRRAIQHFEETTTIDEKQKEIDSIVVSDIKWLDQNIDSIRKTKIFWKDLVKEIEKIHFCSQEVVFSCFLELYPEITDRFQDQMNADEELEIPYGKTIQDTIELIKNRYSWAININFSLEENNYWFWYLSEDKEEPRIGIRTEEYGVEKELPLDIGKQVCSFFNALKKADHERDSLINFLIKNPEYRSIARRVWTMGRKIMGEIQANILAKSSLPIHLLRCKLAAFGATKFDPRSDRWVRITLFQGAPLPDELHEGEWLFPLIPN